MGEFLAELIVEADLGRPHIVAPDVGTSAALFAAAAHPERIASVVVGTGGAAVPLELGEPLRSWVLDPDLDKYRAIDPHMIVNAAVDTIAGGISDEIRADYLACYEGDRFVESMRYVRSYPEELPALAELLPEIATPVTIINGRNDRVVPVANAEFLDERLPNSRLEIIDAGHFVWEEAPAEYASIILDSHRPKGLTAMKRILIFACSTSTLGGAAAALAGSTPIGPLPAGPASHDRRSALVSSSRSRCRSAAPVAFGASRGPSTRTSCAKCRRRTSERPSCSCSVQGSAGSTTVSLALTKSDASSKALESRHVPGPGALMVTAIRNSCHGTAETQFVEAAGVDFAYRRFGRPARTAPRAAAALPRQPRQLGSSADRRARGEREVILVDYPGVGSSTGDPSSTIAETARQMIAFVAALGLDRDRSARVLDRRLRRPGDRARSGRRWFVG